MTVIDAPAPNVDDVVARIRDNVWTLVRAGKLDAAVVLLESVVEEFDRVWMRDVREAVGIPEPPALPAAPAPELVTPTDIETSEEISELDVAPPATLDPTPTGTMVYVVTGAKPTNRGTKTPRVQQPAGTRRAS